MSDQSVRPLSPPQAVVNRKRQTPSAPVSSGSNNIASNETVMNKNNSDASFSSLSLKNKSYPTDSLAKKFNNIGSSLVTGGHFDEGIALLTKALKLAEINFSENRNKIVCSCKYCSLGMCLPVHCNDNRRTKGNKINSSRDSTNGNDIMECDDDIIQCNFQAHPHPEYHENDGFVYRRFLFVTNQSMEKHHFLGITLSLIIMLNLALAHHQRAIQNNEIAGLEEAMKLYELAYQLHSDLINGQNQEHLHNDHAMTSLRLTIIVSNNIGAIHRILGNSLKHRMCVQHLLSVIMYIIDNKVVMNVLDSTELDGIIQNISLIVLDKICASAA